MNNNTALILTATMALLLILCIACGFNEVIHFLWLNVEKIGALATALALIFAIQQGKIAQKAARISEASNQENIFQQLFNLILDQHNTEMRIVKEWLSNMSRAKDNDDYIDFKEKSTYYLVKSIRGNNKLSPYMRLLHHTLKTIKLKHGRTNITTVQFLECKRYSSLVRSFIPNEILYLIALNALITNNSYGEDTDYEQYKEYYYNLVYFDFFEHLIIEKLDITFTEFINNIEQKIIKDVLYQVNASITTLPSNEESHLAAYMTNGHTQFINNMFLNPNFCIAVYYNHPEKYLTVDESYINNKTFKENIESSIDEFFMINKKNNSFEVFNNAFNESINKDIEFYFKKQRTCEISNQGPVREYRFLDFKDSRLISYLRDAINLNQSEKDLTYLKDNISQVIKRLLDSYSHKFLQHDPDIYQDHYNKTHKVFCKEFLLLIEKTIKTKNYISNAENIESLFIQKRQELKNRVSIYLSGVN